MKNFFISILLLASFSAPLFAAGESKNQPANAVLTYETQLELVVLYGAFTVAGLAAWQVGGGRASEAAGGAVSNCLWDAAKKAAGGDAMDAARRAAMNDAGVYTIGSWAAIIRKLSEIQKEVRLEPIEIFNKLTPDESARLYTEVIKNFKQTFEDSLYNMMLDPIKTFYIVSLARIFPHENFFRERPEFIAYNIGDLVRLATHMPSTLSNLIGDYTCDSFDPEIFHAYVLEKLGEL